VELFESETIVARGRRRVAYWVRYNDGWTPAREHPAASVEQLSPAPGTVWERRVCLELAVGTRLLYVESAPRPEPARDPLEYLGMQRQGPKRRSTRRELVVGPRGELVRVKP